MVMKMALSSLATSLGGAAAKLAINYLGNRINSKKTSKWDMKAPDAYSKTELTAEAIKTAAGSSIGQRITNKVVDKIIPKSKLSTFVEQYNEFKPTAMDGWEGLKAVSKAGFNAYKNIRSFNEELRNTRLNNEYERSERKAKGINNAPSDVDKIPQPPPVKINSDPNPHPHSSSSTSYGTVNEPFPRVDSTYQQSHRGYTYPPPETEYKLPTLHNPQASRVVRRSRKSHHHRHRKTRR